MKNRLLSLGGVLLLTLSNVSAQIIVPTIQWDKSFGGQDSDILNSLQQTADGGYIVGGSSLSTSISGNKTSPNQGTYSYDFWIIKLDAGGNKEWEATFGGDGTDYLRSLEQTSDGGYILGGQSNAVTSTGTKSASQYGGYDFWVVKVNSQGEKEWDISYGGNLDEQINTLKQTSNEGFLFGGPSTSPVSGNKTAELYDDVYNFGNSGDFWIVKTDALGNIQWDKSFGGPLKDTPYSLQESPSGGYLLGGQNSGNFWIVKTDPSGTAVWDYSIGGNEGDAIHALRLTSDGGYILVGQSESPISGTKTTPNFGFSDGWIVKLDSQRNPEWQQTFGGEEFDTIRSVEQVNDGGYILGATSRSGTFGNKTSSNHGGWDMWLIRTDTQGNKIWESSFGGSESEELASVELTTDGGYIVGGSSSSTPSGNKNALNYGNDDYWVVKLEGDAQLKTESHVISWPFRAGAVLESTLDLNTGWESYNGEAFQIAETDFVSIDLDNDSEYFQLRMNELVTEPSVEANLEIGTLLTWPTVSNQILETARSQIGPWEAFQGVQGVVEDSNIAIIPQAQSRHYFRTRTAN